MMDAIRRDTSPEAIERARQKHAESVARWQERQRKPLPKVNAARKARRAEAGEVYGPYHAWTATLPCAVRGRGCWGRVTGHHLKSVGAGGKDAANEVPLCASHHTEVHGLGMLRFNARYGCDLIGVALDVHARWMKRA